MRKKSKIAGVIIFVLSILFFDNIIGLLSYNYLPKITYGFLGKINRSLTERSDILILGSSRAMHHYNPEIISTKLIKSTFNAGLGGYGLFLNYAILNEKVEFTRPDIVILDIAPNVIADPKSYEKLTSLLPYYKDYLSFREIIKLNPDFNFLYLIFKTVIFNSTLYDFYKNIFYTNDGSRNGFVPLSAVLNPENFSKMHFQSTQIDSNKILYFKKIISVCKENDIELYVVISPCYVKYDERNKIIGRFKSIAKNNNISFFDFSSDPVFSGKPNLFKDQLHLNRQGADLFSNIVSEKIEAIRNNKH